jgi:hypothetical protein
VKTDEVKPSPWPEIKAFDIKTACFIAKIASF